MLLNERIEIVEIIVRELSIIFSFIELLFELPPTGSLPSSDVPLPVVPLSNSIELPLLLVRVLSLALIFNRSLRQSLGQRELRFLIFCNLLIL